MENNSSILCAFCHKPITNIEESFVCDECGALYHEECWGQKQSTEEEDALCSNCGKEILPLQGVQICSKCGAKHHRQNKDGTCNLYAEEWDADDAFDSVSPQTWEPVPPTQQAAESSAFTPPPKGELRISRKTLVILCILAVVLIVIIAPYISKLWAVLPTSDTRTEPVVYYTPEPTPIRMNEKYEASNIRYDATVEFFDDGWYELYIFDMGICVTYQQRMYEYEDGILYLYDENGKLCDTQSCEFRGSKMEYLDLTFHRVEED